MARPTNRMPADVKALLLENDVMDAYLERPFYQRNDYLGWIERAKRPDTRARRMEQMIDELRNGGVYMNMRHAPSERRDGPEAPD